MSSKDKETVQELLQKNFEFKQLHREHETLENKLEQMAKLKFVDSDDERKKKELQKRKLFGRDRMQAILRQYQEQT